MTGFQVWWQLPSLRFGNSNHRSIWPSGPLLQDRHGSVSETAEGQQEILAGRKNIQGRQRSAPIFHGYQAERSSRGWKWELPAACLALTKAVL